MQATPAGCSGHFMIYSDNFIMLFLRANIRSSDFVLLPSMQRFLRLPVNFAATAKALAFQNRLVKDV
jgi:hypothetical protein